MVEGKKKDRSVRSLKGKRKKKDREKGKKVLLELAEEELSRSLCVRKRERRRCKKFTFYGGGGKKKNRHVARKTNNSAEKKKKGEKKKQPFFHPETGKKKIGFDGCSVNMVRGKKTSKREKKRGEIEFIRESGREKKEPNFSVGKGPKG